MYDCWVVDAAMTRAHRYVKMDACVIDECVFEVNIYQSNFAIHHEEANDAASVSHRIVHPCFDHIVSFIFHPDAATHEK